MNKILGPKLYVLEERNLPDGEWYADELQGDDDIGEALRTATEWATFEYEKEEGLQEVRVVEYTRGAIVAQIRSPDPQPTATAPLGEWAALLTQVFPGQEALHAQWAELLDATFPQPGLREAVRERLSEVLRPRGVQAATDEPKPNVCEQCGAPPAHAEHFRKRVRFWCKEHTPWSGHFEYCGDQCAQLVAQAKS